MGALHHRAGPDHNDLTGNAVTPTQNIIALKITRQGSILALRPRAPCIRVARPHTHAFPHVFTTAGLAGREAHIVRLLCAGLERREGRFRYGTFLRRSSGKYEPRGNHCGDCKRRNSHCALPVLALPRAYACVFYSMRTVRSRGMVLRYKKARASQRGPR
jgi:hypothetical protein